MTGARPPADHEAFLAAERELAVDLERYVGQWVAVNEHLVIAYAPTLAEVIAEVGDRPCEGVFQVITSGPCFFGARVSGTPERTPSEPEEREERRRLPVAQDSPQGQDPREETEPPMPSPRSDRLSCSGSLGAAEAGKAEAQDAAVRTLAWRLRQEAEFAKTRTGSDLPSLLVRAADQLDALAAERARAATLTMALADNERDARWIVGQWQRLRDEPLNEVAKAIVTRARDAQEHQT